MKKHIYILLFLGQFAFLLNSCKEKCNSDLLERRFICENNKAYFSFGREGSYWIYQNQDESKIDSLYVSQYSYYWQKDNVLCFTSETMNINLKSIGENLVFSDSVCLQLNHEAANFKSCENSLFFENYDYVSCIPNSLETVTLNGIEYKEVYDLQKVDYSLYHLYLQKNICIIGWVTPTDTFNLIRHYIAK